MRRTFRAKGRRGGPSATGQVVRDASLEVEVGMAIRVEASDQARSTRFPRPSRTAFSYTAAAAATSCKAVPVLHLWNVVHRKLDMLNAARDLMDLRAAPSNRLEKLKGNLSGYWSIRVNDQYRVIFRFANGNADAVRITDYH
jgi:proteic killer suppression protein